MRMMMIAAALALGGCATAVSDSLERRGVGSGAVLVERLDSARTDMTAAANNFAAAEAALDAVGSLDGPLLAQQSSAVRAAGQNAALSAQDLRLSLDSAKSAAVRYFRDQEDELELMGATDEGYRAASDALSATRGAWRAYEAATESAALRLSPALSLYEAEASALRRSPTSGLAAAERAQSRANAIAAVKDVRASLGVAVQAGDDLRTALN